MSARPLVIIGGGGFAREVHDVVEAINAVQPTWDLLGVLADGHSDEELLAARGMTHLGEVNAFEGLDPAAAYVIGIGDGSARQSIDEYATSIGRTAGTLIHPHAVLGRHSVDVGAGSIVCAGVVMTTNIRVGRHSHINIGSTVGHDVVIGSYVTISPGVHLSGKVTLDDGVTLGTGASVLPGKHVGAEAVVGAQAAVVNDIDAGLTVVGIPARPR